MKTSLLFCVIFLLSASGGLFAASQMVPEVEEAVAPSYPRLTTGEEGKEQGEVQVDIGISTNGQVTYCKAVSGPEWLRPAAENAARAWRFRPMERSIEKWSITFAFIMKKDVSYPPAISTIFKLPNRVEIYTKYRKIVKEIQLEFKKANEIPKKNKEEPN